MSSIKAPRSIDVLFGRDTGSWSHEGNRVFRAVIREHQVEYHSKKTRSEKMNIVAKIMGQMARLGARFLKLDKTNREWQEVGRKAVIEKVRTKTSPINISSPSTLFSTPKLNTFYISGWARNSRQTCNCAAQDHQKKQGKKRSIGKNQRSGSPFVISSIFRRAPVFCI